MIKCKPAEAKMLCLDDPVRPGISGNQRTSGHFEMYYTGGLEIGERKAVICCAFCNKIPTTVDELLHSSSGDIAVFYSVWSYNSAPRAGRDIVFSAIALAKERGMRRFVTMSPKTEMARRFHLRNGAILLNENKETNNFEYKETPDSTSNL